MQQPAAPKNTKSIMSQYKNLQKSCIQFMKVNVGQKRRLVSQISTAKKMYTTVKRNFNQNLGSQKIVNWKLGQKEFQERTKEYAIRRLQQKYDQQMQEIQKQDNLLTYMQKSQLQRKLENSQKIKQSLHKFQDIKSKIHQLYIVQGAEQVRREKEATDQE